MYSFILLSLLLNPSGLSGPEALDRQTLHAELSRGGSIFIERQPDRIVLYTAGWRAKELPVYSFSSLRGGDIHASRVQEIVPAGAVPSRSPVVELQPSEADRAATVSSLNDIIGVEEMPDTFVVRFDDGTIWWVTSTDDWQGFLHLFRMQKLRWQTGLAYLGQLSRGNLEEVVFLTLEPAASRELFWLLQIGMPVIQ